ncbi:MAG: hypothetical protein RBS88_07500 [Spongiibacteraceae bacterium]|jgi:hypothetical protein|nr:hypothetical protein [Spongiibacteraceae bacterium]
MALVVAVARFWLGFWMVFWGLNWFVGFFPQPTGGPGSHELHLALMDSGLFSLAKLLETLLGISLLTNRFVPAALVAVAPVTVIVAWVHVLDGPGAPGYFVTFTHLFLLIMYSPHYFGMLAFKARPAESLNELLPRGPSRSQVC